MVFSHGVSHHVPEIRQAQKEIRHVLEPDGEVVITTYARRPFDRKRIERDFPAFQVTRTYKRFMHAPPLRVHARRGQSLPGRHLWAHLELVNKDGARS